MFCSPISSCPAKLLHTTYDCDATQGVPRKMRGWKWYAGTHGIGRHMCGHVY